MNTLKELIERKARAEVPVLMGHTIAGNYEDLNEIERNTWIQGAEFIAGQMWSDEDMRKFALYFACSDREHGVDFHFTQYKAERISAPVKPME